MIRREVINELNISIEEFPKKLVVTFDGTAANNDAEKLAGLFADIRQTGRCKQFLVFDVRTLQFCFSECLKVFTHFSMDASARPELLYCISKAAWQVTSLRLMVNMSPNCSIIPDSESISTGITDEQSLPPAFSSDESKTASSAVESGSKAIPPFCEHEDVRSDEEYFFASSGNGSILTTTTCNKCDKELSRTSEYYD